MSKDFPDRLEFVGKVIKGSGCFSEQLHVPGEKEIPGLICGWPEKVRPGTLNVLIDDNGWPDDYLAKFGKQTEGLDLRRFQPEIELHHSKIGNNTLSPQAGEREDKGNAQIWRSHLTKIESGASIQCWVLRRIGSQMPHRLECVAGEKIRTALGLPEDRNDPVRLVVEGKWQ
jgi:hypothetical protein